MFSRRDMLAVSAAGAVMTASAARAASFGNPDLPPQGAINAKGPGNLADPGPQSPALGNQFPSAQFPPATYVGGMPMDWASFNNAPKRVQNGGWARQVTQADFAISSLPRCLPRILAFRPRHSPGFRCKISGSFREPCPAIWLRTAPQAAKPKMLHLIPLSSGWDHQLRREKTEAATSGSPTAATSSSQRRLRPRW